jgi:hypothetical protein
MKLSKYILLIVLVAGIVISGCQELYDGDTLQNVQRIPVFQGAITDDPGPYTVSIYWASAYNSSQPPTPISDAKVFILDNFKTNQPVKKVSGGIYKTDPNFRGIVGRIYRLRVFMSDGNVYESVPSMLYPKTSFDSIYSEPGFINSINTDVDGNISTTRVDGLNVYAEVIADKNNTNYYKFDCLYILQTTHSPLPKGGPPPVIYCRSLAMESIYQVEPTIDEGNKQIIKKKPLVFLPYHWDLTGTDSTTPIMNAGWIVSATLSSISPEAFKFYLSISEQLNAGAKMFDPIPSQIKGNMHCTTDSTRVALGLFEVTSQTTKNLAFSWYPGEKSITVANVNDIGPLEDECDTGFMPSYWVSFYK